MRRSYRHRYGASEYLLTTALGVLGGVRVARLRRRGALDADLAERIRLAVTEVNGCDVCSYAHARIALRQGMDESQVAGLLAGDGSVIPAAEAKAILFAQHYADCHGRPHRDAYDALVAAYGVERAQLVLAATQEMMVGNVMGLPLSAFLARLRGRPYGNSPLWYELAGLVAPVVALPLGAAIALVLHLVLPEHILFAAQAGPARTPEGHPGTPS